jgi:hypothetical protein
MDERGLSMRQRQNRSMARCVGRVQTDDNRRAAMRASPSSVALDSANDSPLIDKHGRRHSSAVLTAWSQRMLEIMGVRPINTSEREDGAQPKG